MPILQQPNGTGISSNNNKRPPIQISKQNTSGVRRHFLTTRAIEAWNRLSADTVMSPTVNNFKAGLAKDWKHHPNMYEY